MHLRAIFVLCFIICINKKYDENVRKLPYLNLPRNWDTTLCGLDPIELVSLQKCFVVENIENPRNLMSQNSVWRIILIQFLLPMYSKGVEDTQFSWVQFVWWPLALKNTSNHHHIEWQFGCAKRKCSKELLNKKELSGIF